jgi:flagellar basal-body rod modification protein FlgD
MLLPLTVMNFIRSNRMNNISSLQKNEYQVDNQPNTQKSNSNQTLGKDDFLTLLVTQLKNQDPLKPMDPTEFTAQLAQFSSLEQLYNVNENLQVLKSLEGDFDRLSALSMIDKYVVSNSNIFQFENHPVELGFYFQNIVKDATVYVKDINGQIVRDIPIAHPSTGEHFVQWDGKDQDGQQLPEGVYSITIMGITEEDAILAGAPLVRSRITGVDFSDKESQLITTSGKVKLSEINEVNNLTSLTASIE